MVGAVRPYQPVTPAINKILEQRWDQDIFNAHRKKVANAKAVIDNDPPRVHMHLHIKLKKLQFEAERLAMIERDNRILLEKMAHIMRTGGLIDNKKEDYQMKSLNKPKRQRELLRITHENIAILKRLTTKDPHYNHKKWHLQWMLNQKYLMNISQYPHPWRQEQSPYISQIERQHLANKVIMKRVQTKSASPAKLIKGTPIPETRSANNSPAVVKTKSPRTTGLRSDSKQCQMTPTPSVQVCDNFATPQIKVCDYSETPTLHVSDDSEEVTVSIKDGSTV